MSPAGKLVEPAFDSPTNGGEPLNLNGEYLEKVGIAPGREVCLRRIKEVQEHQVLKGRNLENPTDSLGSPKQNQRSEMNPAAKPRKRDTR